MNGSNPDTLAPVHVFNFEVSFFEDPLDSAEDDGDVPMCSGAFSECTGLEATMEPKVIKEGGRNYGAAQRAGPVTFATVILKRGMTTNGDLWGWFNQVTQGDYAYRLGARIQIRDGLQSDTPVMEWKLTNVMPIKFKSADMSAKATEVGIEELHLAHEGLSLVRRGDDVSE
ncbi:MAG: phage tail protein [Acidobacteria bacterium 13_1_20CM_3_53_8]|nr:MAG: phage tail protein [Acidobacteria bacterium 13_1_20CM_3_53_8]